MTSPIKASPNVNALAMDFATPKTGMTTLTVLDGPDLTDVGELLEVMKQTLSSLGATFDSLGEQTARVAAIGPAMESAHQINHLRRQLQVQDRKQEERITELKILLRDVLKEQIIEHLRGHVYAMIREQVAQQVRDQVEFQLREQIPQKLRDQVREHKRQIAEVRKSLHNSEARRANSLLRSNHLLEPLHPLVRSTGEVSEIFPKNLAAIFALGPASARQLCQEYGLPETDSRERNLNKFMHHIGVAFQMVAANAPTAQQPPLVTAS